MDLCLSATLGAGVTRTASPPATRPRAASAATPRGKRLGSARLGSRRRRSDTQALGLTSAAGVTPSLRTGRPDQCDYYPKRDRLMHTPRHTPPSANEPAADQGGKAGRGGPLGVAGLRGARSPGGGSAGWALAGPEQPAAWCGWPCKTVSLEQPVGEPAGRALSPQSCRVGAPCVRASERTKCVPVRLL